MENLHMHNDEKNNLLQLQKQSSWFMGLGILLVIIGILATVFALASTLFSMIYLGIIFIGLGVAELLKACKTRSLNKFFLVHMALALLYGAAGIFIVIHPLENAVTLTLFFAFLFIVAGTLRIIFALTQDVPHKWWVLLNGCITTLLGVLILQEWPQSGLWVIGLFVGVNALFTGISWIMLATVLQKKS